MKTLNDILIKLKYDKNSSLIEAHDQILILFDVSNNEVAVSCSTCKWLHAKYDYKCDRCFNNHSKWEQDTDC